jgi:tetratricopeptide (TPR) repeat protein
LTTDPFIGRRLDGYELVRRIGEGGMGAVYCARRVDSGETVAVKLIKRGMDTDAMLRRFQNERRILAALDHPNVARLLDAGATPDGLPYFVMEHIAGEPINRYCDARKLSIDERLRLFLKVCGAVESAHQIQVIHRDIKPENILVTAEGEPKLLDFGIAKILNQDFAAASQEVTVTLGPAMTPYYASPEQTRGGLVTPATDIYSLGVLLYELLTGQSPYRPAERSAQALADAICHQRPRPPSVAVARLAAGDATTREIGANRAAELSRLRSVLAGDLDAIVLIALAKEPSQRYSSVAEFAADIARHLEGTRVHARRFGRRYSRMLARSRRQLAFAMVVLVVILGLAAVYFRRGPAGLRVRPSVAVLGFENLSHQQSAEWLSTALTEMLSTELAAGGRLRTVPGELVSRVKLELALPNAQTFTQSTLSRLRESLSSDFVVLGSYLALGEGNDLKVRLDLRLQNTRNGEVVASVSETRSSAELLELVTRSGALLRRQLGAGDLPVADSDSVRGSLPRGAEAARAYSEGLERLRTFDTLAARDLLRAAAAAAPEHALSHSALAAASSLLGYDVEARDEAGKALALSSGLSREARLLIEGRYSETTHAWERAVATFRTLRNQYPDNLEYGLDLSSAQAQAGDARGALETVASIRALPSAANDPRVDLAEAEAALRASDLQRARAAARKAADSGSSKGLRILAARARLLEGRIALQLGDPQRALAAAAESQQLYLAAGHRQGVARALNESAGVLTQLGDVAGARARYEEALAVCRTVGDQSCIGTDLDSIGVLRRRQGDLRGALDMHQKALEIRRNVGDRAGVATSLYNLGNVLETMGDLARAREAAAQSLEIRTQLGERRAIALTMSRVGNIRRRQGELNEAYAATREAVARLRAIGDRGGTAMAMVNFGMVLFDQGDLAGARAVLEEALATRRQQRDKNNTAQALAVLAEVALAQGKVAEASSLIAESISLREQLGEAISLAQSKLALSSILLRLESFAAAEKEAREAARSFHAAGAAGWEAEGLLAVAEAQIARGNRAQAKAALEAAGRLLRESRDAHALRRRDRVLARLGKSGADPG